MTFGTLAAGWVALGLAALAGVLYLLQRLRVRHREQPVVTTLFWHEAVREERVRVLTGRFRHPLAYLLALLIAGLLWFAIADPRAGGSDAGEVAILLDGSAGMARGDRFESAAADALAAARSGPRGRTRVILCAGRPRTLLAPHEDVLLLQERLADAAPVAAPATVAETIEELVSTESSSLTIRVAGDAPVRAELLALLPDRVRVSRLGAAAPADGANRSITALGVTEPVSGRWGVVDVMVTVAGAVDDAPPDVRIDGVSWDAAPTARDLNDSRQFVWDDVPARGGRLEVTVAGGAGRVLDSLALDDVAAVQLPDRPPTRVRVHADVPAVVRAVLAADPSVILVDADPTVEVRTTPDESAGAPPALLIVHDDAQSEAIQVLHDPQDDSEQVLRRAVEGLGLSRIDAPELAQALGRPIGLGAVPSPNRAVALWSSLLEERTGFVHTRAFPLFVARSVRWLAGAGGVTPTLASGRYLAVETSWTDASGARLAGVGAAFPAPRAGDYTDASGRPVVVSLLDPSAHGAAVEDSLSSDRVAGGGFDLVSVLALLAFALLGVEWALYRTGRMP